MKNNCYERYNDPEIKKLQIVYLRYQKQVIPSQMRPYVDYKISTIRTYASKFKYLLDDAIQFFEGNYEDIKMQAYAYIVEYECDEGYFLKVGKTTNLNTRMKSIEKQYKTSLFTCIATYEFDNEEDALIFESIMRKYYKQKFPNQFIRQDRFVDVCHLNTDLEFFDNQYDIIGDII